MTSWMGMNLEAKQLVFIVLPCEAWLELEHSSRKPPGLITQRLKTWNVGCGARGNVQLFLSSCPGDKTVNSLDTVVISRGSWPFSLKKTWFSERRCQALPSGYEWKTLYASQLFATGNDLSHFQDGCLNLPVYELMPKSIGQNFRKAVSSSGEISLPLYPEHRRRLAFLIGILVYNNYIMLSKVIIATDILLWNLTVSIIFRAAWSQDEYRWGWHC
ncbi:hypothetical protein PGT21_004021 [Puccinia graminis f. sp. tritici]|uniref:Uncharacterized protein n=1 Tax=Puccinia graminis f. sp. tritici TaxID=56615 RepID=A0A5B0NRJ3_PUCGR|nr:hypothetical protein PGT21_004021 [Puccinia graminis f. sp. tritici]